MDEHGVVLMRLWSLHVFFVMLSSLERRRPVFLVCFPSYKCPVPSAPGFTLVLNSCQAALADLSSAPRFRRLFLQRQYKAQTLGFGAIVGFIEGSLEVKLPTIWTRWKAEMGRVREKRRVEREKSRREKIRERRSQKKEDAGARKVGKSRNSVFFHWFVAQRVEK